MTKGKSDDAVSPVIGVMLLLVVTIVIAAVVAVFASGVGTDAEPAPATVLSVVEVSDGRDIVTYGYDMPDHDIDNEFGLGNIVPGDDWDGESYSGKVLDRSGNHLATLEGGQIVAVTEKGLEQYFALVEERQPDEKVTMTFSCVNGEPLNLEKISIKVYKSNGDTVAEIQQGILSGIISAGEKKTVTLIEWDSSMLVSKGDKVEVMILYGDHVIVNKEMKVTRG